MSMPLSIHILCLILIISYCVYLFLQELTENIVFLKELHYQGSVSHIYSVFVTNNWFNKGFIHMS